MELGQRTKDASFTARKVKVITMPRRKCCFPLIRQNLARLFDENLHENPTSACDKPVKNPYSIAHCLHKYYINVGIEAMTYDPGVCVVCEAKTD